MSNGETIGKCDCIDMWDKHYIVVVLEEAILKESQELRNIENRRKLLEESELARSGLLDVEEGIIKPHIDFKKALEGVLERVKAVPECKG